MANWFSANLNKLNEIVQLQPEDQQFNQLQAQVQALKQELAQKDELIQKLSNQTPDHITDTEQKLAKAVTHLRSLAQENTTLSNTVSELTDKLNSNEQVIENLKRAQFELINSASIDLQNTKPNSQEITDLINQYEVKLNQKNTIIEKLEEEKLNIELELDEIKHSSTATDITTHQVDTLKTEFTVKLQERNMFIEKLEEEKLNVELELDEIKQANTRQMEEDLQKRFSDQLNQKISIIEKLEEEKLNVELELVELKNSQDVEELKKEFNAKLDEKKHIIEKLEKEKLNVELELDELKNSTLQHNDNSQAVEELKKEFNAKLDEKKHIIEKLEEEKLNVELELDELKNSTLQHNDNSQAVEELKKEFNAKLDEKKHIIEKLEEEKLNVELELDELKNSPSQHNDNSQDVEKLRKEFNAKLNEKFNIIEKLEEEKLSLELDLDELLNKSPQASDNEKATSLQLEYETKINQQTKTIEKLEQEKLNIELELDELKHQESTSNSIPQEQLDIIKSEYDLKLIKSKEIIESLMNQQQEYQITIDNLKNGNTQLTEKIQSLKNDSDERIRILNTENSKLLDKINKTTPLIQSLTQEKQIFQEELKTLVIQQSEYLQQIESLNKSLDDARTGCSGHEDEIQRLNETKSNLEQEISELGERENDLLQKIKNNQASHNSAIQSLQLEIGKLREVGNDVESAKSEFERELKRQKDEFELTLLKQQQEYQQDLIDPLNIQVEQLNLKVDEFESILQSEKQLTKNETFQHLLNWLETAFVELLINYLSQLYTQSITKINILQNVQIIDGYKTVDLLQLEERVGLYIGERVDEYLALQKEYEDLKESVKKSKEDVSAVEDNNAFVEELQNRILSITQEKDQYASDYDVLLEKLREMKNTVGPRLQAEIEEGNLLRAQVQQLESQKEANETFISTLQNKIDELNKLQNSSTAKAHQEEQETVSIVQSLTQQLEEIKEKLGKSNREEARLRQHLIETEDTFTQESMNLQLLIDELRTENTKLQESTQNDQDVRDDMIEQMNTNNQALKEALTKMQEYQEENSVLVNENREFQTAVLNLQNVLKEFEDSKDSELEEVSRRAREEVERSKVLVEEYKQNYETLKFKLEKIEKVDTTMTKLQEELIEKNALVLKLRQEVKNTQLHLGEAMKRIANGSQDAIDTKLITNLLVTFISAPRGDKTRYEMLNIISGMLKFSDEDKYKVGLAGKPSSGIVRRGSSALSVASPIDTDGQSFTDLWISYLLKETSATDDSTSKE